jgi:hypothetical protein
MDANGPDIRVSLKKSSSPVKMRLPEVSTDEYVIHNVSSNHVKRQKKNLQEKKEPVPAVGVVYVLENGHRSAMKDGLDKLYSIPIGGPMNPTKR